MGLFERGIRGGNGGSIPDLEGMPTQSPTSRTNLYFGLLMIALCIAILSLLLLDPTEWSFKVVPIGLVVMGLVASTLVAVGRWIVW